MLPPCDAPEVGEVLPVGRVDIVRCTGGAEVRVGGGRVLRDGRTLLPDVGVRVAPGDHVVSGGGWTLRPAVPPSGELAIDGAVVGGYGTGITGRVSGAWTFSIPLRIELRASPLLWGTLPEGSIATGGGTVGASLELPMVAVGLAAGVGPRTADDVDLDTWVPTLEPTLRIGRTDGAHGAVRLPFLFDPPCWAGVCPGPRLWLGGADVELAIVVSGRGAVLLEVEHHDGGRTGGRVVWEQDLVGNRAPGGLRIRAGLAYEQIHGQPGGNPITVSGVGLSLGASWRIGWSGAGSGPSRPR